MKKWFWLIVGFLAIGVYTRIGIEWVPVVWQTSWGDALVIALALLVTAFYVANDMIKEYYES